MFGFTVELILILVTLAAAVLGTVSNPSRSLKAAIIGLAVVTSVGTVVTLLETNRAAERNARSITALVQAIDPPEYFNHDMVRAMRPLLEGTGMFVGGASLQENGERVLFLNKDDGSDDLAGVLFLSRRQLEPVFYAYALQEDLTEPLRAHLATRWTDCDVHRDDCLYELRRIAQEAFDVSPFNVSQSSAEMADDLSFTLVSDAVWRGEPVTVSLDGAFVRSLYGLDPATRGLRILEAAQTVLIDQL